MNSTTYIHLIFTALFVAFSQAAWAQPPASAALVPEREIVTEEVKYGTNGTQMVGYLAYPKAAKNLPAVLVVHEWWGQTEYLRIRAEMLAKTGFVAMAVDMYGDRRIAKHPKEATKFTQETMSKMDEATRRFEAAMDYIKKRPQVDAQRIAAVGYCFGGGIVLAMAARGLDLDGVASIHGSMPDIETPQKGQVKAEILLLNGAADVLVKKEDIQGVANKMRSAGAEVEIVNYEGAKHAFTNPEATASGKKFDLPLAYSADADKKSWQRLQEFLKNIF